jgi:hypothetical protein
LYELLGGRLLYGSRDGDWALVQFGGSALSLLAHPPGGDSSGPVELHFISDEPLEQLEERLQEASPDTILQKVSDEAFGRSLKLRSPDGLVIKVLELERDLIA